MSSDPLWNEIRSNLQLEQPSEAFTDNVLDAVQSRLRSQAANQSAGHLSTRGPSQRYRNAIPHELMNALLATAATFLLVATGAWSFGVVSMQEGTFSMAVRETVSNTIYTGIELLNEAIHLL